MVARCYPPCQKAQQRKNTKVIFLTKIWDLTVSFSFKILKSSRIQFQDYLWSIDSVQNNIKINNHKSLKLYFNPQFFSFCDQLLLFLRIIFEIQMLKTLICITRISGRYAPLILAPAKGSSLFHPFSFFKKK